MYAYKCGNDSENKLKGISKSQSKNNTFGEYKKMFRWRGLSTRM